MVNNLPSGLLALCNDFIPEDKAKGKAAKGSMKESAKVKTPNPRAEMSYTYLIAWLVILYPSLMSAIDYCPLDKPFFVEMYEYSTWKSHYMLVICKTL